MIKKKSNLLNRQSVVELVHRKSILLLSRYMTRFDNIKPRKYSGHSVSMQKKMRKHIIRAREIGLLAYTK